MASQVPTMMNIASRGTPAVRRGGDNTAVKLTFLSDKLTFLSDKLAFLSSELTFLSYKLTFLSYKTDISQL